MWLGKDVTEGISKFNYSLHVMFHYWCGHAGSSFKVEIDTHSIDAVGIKTEADGIDSTEFSHDDKPSRGMFFVFLTCLKFFNILGKGC